MWTVSGHLRVGGEGRAPPPKNPQVHPSPHSLAFQPCHEGGEGSLPSCREPPLPRGLCLKMISPSWGLMVRHLCWGTPCPPPLPPTPTIASFPSFLGPLSRVPLWKKGGGGFTAHPQASAGCNQQTNPLFLNPPTFSFNSHAGDV